MPARAVTNVDRGCGRRQAGGIYLEVGVGPNGLPLEAFIVDPVVAVSTDQQRQLGVIAVGVHLVERGDGSGIVDVWDIVGESHYPNPADFLEEARRYGVSRRARQTLDFSRIGPYSRLIVLHRKAAVMNWPLYAQDWTRACPMIDAGRPLPETHELAPNRRASLCAGIWWEDVLDGKPSPWLGDNRRVSRDMPPGKHQWRYIARERPQGVIPIYSLGIMANFPLTRLAVVADPKGKHETALAAARKANLDVEEADE